MSLLVPFGPYSKQIWISRNSGRQHLGWTQTHIFYSIVVLHLPVDLSQFPKLIGVQFDNLDSSTFISLLFLYRFDNFIVLFILLCELSHSLDFGSQLEIPLVSGYVFFIGIDWYWVDWQLLVSIMRTKLTISTLYCYRDIFDTVGFGFVVDSRNVNNVLLS